MIDIDMQPKLKAIRLLIVDRGDNLPTIVTDTGAYGWKPAKQASGRSPYIMRQALQAYKRKRWQQFTYFEIDNEK